MAEDLPVAGAGAAVTEPDMAVMAADAGDDTLTGKK